MRTVTVGSKPVDPEEELGGIGGCFGISSRRLLMLADRERIG